MSENYAARPHPEFVVLEIGEQIGALVIHTDAELHGVEVEISPTGADDDRSHKEVLERRAGGQPAHTAVFDGLPEGSYTLWIGNVACASGVQVTGGVVARLDWTGASAPVQLAEAAAYARQHAHAHTHGHTHTHAA
jgi:hypothetical protein